MRSQRKSGGSRFRYRQERESKKVLDIGATRIRRHKRARRSSARLSAPPGSSGHRAAALTQGKGLRKSRGAPFAAGTALPGFFASLAASANRSCKPSGALRRRHIASAKAAGPSWQPGIAPAKLQTGFGGENRFCKNAGGLWTSQKDEGFRGEAVRKPPKAVCKIASPPGCLQIAFTVFARPIFRLRIAPANLH